MIGTIIACCRPRPEGTELGLHDLLDQSKAPDHFDQKMSKGTGTRTEPAAGTGTEEIIESEDGPAGVSRSRGRNDQSRLRTDLQSTLNKLTGTWKFMVEKSGAENRRFLIITVVLTLAASAGAILILFYNEDKAPDVSESYKYLNKPQSSQSALPDELTASLVSRSKGRWYANGPVVDADLEALLKREATINSLSLNQAEVTPEVLSRLKGKGLIDLVLIDMDAEKYIDTISGMDGLISLRLRDSSPLDPAIKRLTGPRTLNILCLSRCRLGNGGMAAIADNLPQLGSLNVNGCKELTDGCVSSLKRMKRMQALFISHTSISAHGAGDVAASLDNLQMLHVAGLGITDETVINSLCKRRLKNVDLSETLITGRSLKHLASIRTLAGIGLRGCRNLSQADIEWFGRQRPDCKVKAVEDARNPLQLEPL